MQDWVVVCGLRLAGGACIRFARASRLSTPVRLGGQQHSDQATPSRPASSPTPSFYASLDKAGQRKRFCALTQEIYEHEQRERHSSGSTSVPF
jgi:hypothetical protein